MKIFLSILSGILLITIFVLKVDAENKTWWLPPLYKSDPEIKVVKIQDTPNINCYIAESQQSGGQGWTGTNLSISCVKIK